MQPWRCLHIGAEIYEISQSALGFTGYSGVAKAVVLERANALIPKVIATVKLHLM